MRPLKLARQLKPVPELGAHQITASQLATNGMDGNPTYKATTSVASSRYAGWTRSSSDHSAESSTQFSHRS